MSENEYAFGSGLDDEEAGLVAALSPMQIDAVDEALRHDATPRWTKVARILANFLRERPGIPDDLPREFIWERLRRLVEQGELEAQGNLRFARASEVRCCPS
jgi:aryl-alcohol dehydrogenase-like predicted oxidoreductase